MSELARNASHTDARNLLSPRFIEAFSCDGANKHACDKVVLCVCVSQRSMTLAP